MFNYTSKPTSSPEPRFSSSAGEVERLRLEVQTLRARITELEELSSNDELVGLPNRRSFIQSLNKLIDRVSRYNEPAAMIFVDLDGLKRINDTFGHAVGDAALRKVAALLLESVRTSDCVGRLSGDEFGVLLTHTEELGAWQMALRMVERVANAQFSSNGNAIRLSVAVGVGMLRPGDDPLQAIARADEQMYRIKRSSSKLGTLSAD